MKSNWECSALIAILIKKKNVSLKIMVNYGYHERLIMDTNDYT